jgi:tetratricopeptide (TPR) repeat protein
MKSCFASLVLFVATSLVLFSQSPDEQYVRIYQLIQEADQLNDSGQKQAALAKYIEAQQGLGRFREVYPGWNERVINYRLNYVTTKLTPLAAALSGAPRATTNTTPAPPTVAVGTVVPAPHPTTNDVSAAAIMNRMPADVENQLKTLQAEVDRLQADNRLLGAKLKEALSVQPAAIDPRELAKAEERIRALQKENALFQAQLEGRSKMPAPAASEELLAKITEQNNALMALRTENEVLKRHRAEWQQKFEVLSAGASNAAPAVASLNALTAQNRALLKQVELWKQVAERGQRSALESSGEMPADAQAELKLLRARVQVLEAKPVPYSAEELALFQKSPPSFTADIGTPSTVAPPSSVGAVPPAEGPLRRIVRRGTPPGAGALVLAAERAFNRGQFAEAEQKYSELLRQDESNLTTLANLAAAQVELGRLGDAEKHIQRAIQMDPNDYFALYLLGRLRFEQDKVDEALDALSRSVQSNSEYAASHNYLGIVLSEKGLRGPAEAALRRAIQLQPDYAVAHNNLALVYATQQPPALALARWHYRKAVSSGHPKNPDIEKLLGQVAQ